MGSMRCWRIYSGCPKGVGRQLALGSARMHIECCNERREVGNRIRRVPTVLAGPSCAVRHFTVLHLRLARW